MNALVDFEAFRPDLEQAVPRADRSTGGRPPFDHVLMFRVLILQASHSLSDERTEYLVKDRLSFMRFLGLSLRTGCRMRTRSGHFREALTRAHDRRRPGSRAARPRARAPACTHGGVWGGVDVGGSEGSEGWSEGHFSGE